MRVEYDAVVIGRNEAARLGAALGAVLGLARRVIYVDSGSRDGSVGLARANGVEVLELDPARPFSAARARNEGFAALGEDRAAFVQFIDADCLLVPGWLERALGFLEAHPQAGLVIGRYREEAPEASVYNWLTDWEWDKPEGPEAAGIGTFMARAGAFAQTGGFRDSMIAAEDDEMFLRMRGLGWQTWSIAAPMCSHDAGLHRFRPWWRRMIRAGHSFAELGALHPGTAAAAQRRALLWGGLLPLAGLAGAVLWWPLVVGVVALYLAAMARQGLRFARMGAAPARAGAAAGLVMLSKFANLYGMGWYWLRRLRRSDAQIIEYK
ncbi:glycosyltransferase [Natronohydrobacter thiooxidans]|uniref:glycosyltransferase n=1 Tax=Natronohydrobacter thiooxidans TaxID=87172 RepID=UPI001FE2DDF0|nr:glycosyltransferase family A protein [Natronohydrobacter thiooxidans]